MPYLSTLNDLQNQLGDVKIAIKNGGVSAALTTELVANQNMLQSWIDKIVAGGQVNDQDIYALENALTDSKKKTLEAKAQRTKRDFILIGAGLIVSIGLIIFLLKHKK